MMIFSVKEESFVIDYEHVDEKKVWPFKNDYFHLEIGNGIYALDRSKKPLLYVVDKVSLIQISCRISN